jgi:N-acetylglucosaminyldiphosphoundecaprenol N-acetyl-beta-D-mannosaminyltransferase
MSFKLLGVNLDLKDETETLNFIKQKIKENKQNLITTVNPEFLVAAYYNQNFKRLLNETELNTCDGFGIKLIGKLFYRINIPRVTGVDLSLKLLNDKSDNFKIFLLGSTPDTLKKLVDKYDNSNLVGFDSGGRMLDDGKLENNEMIIEKINLSQANILLAAFNQVQQETWLKNNLSLMPNIKIAIGVGGTFDFLSGRIKRAPKWLRLIGLEWLYRLIQEPKRLKRIWRATIVFPWLALKEKIIN